MKRIVARTAEALASALHDVKEAAEALEAFLSTHAPHWAGYGRYIAEFASELTRREMANSDLRALQDRAYEPFRGTFGSMHDLSFIGSLETEYQDVKARLGRALDGVEAAFRRLSSR